MRYPLQIAFAIICLPLLFAVAGCGTISVANQVQDAAAEADANDTLAKKMADQILGEVSGQDNRSVRLCMIAAVGSELVYFRASKDPGQALAAFGSIEILDAAVNRFEAADEMWMNTEIAYVVFAITQVIVDSAKARIPQLLSNFAGGVNVLGLLDRAEIAAGQGTLMAAGIKDIRARIAALNSGAAQADSSMIACRARINLNRQRVSALIGGSAVNE